MPKQTLFLIDLLEQESPDPNDVATSIAEYAAKGWPMQSLDVEAIINKTNFETPEQLRSMWSYIQEAMSNDKVTGKTKEVYRSILIYLTSKIRGFYHGM